MNKKQYCQKMLMYKERKIPPYLFLGGKWIFLKILLLGMGAILLFLNSVEGKVLGGVSIGYALGKIAAGLMSYKISRKTWVYSDDLLNWDKIAKYANESEERKT